MVIPIERQGRHPRHQPRRDPLVLGPEAQRQARHGARAASTPGTSTPTSPASTPVSAPSSAGCRTPTCGWRSSRSTTPTSRPGSTTSSSRTSRPKPARWPPPARQTFIAQCSRCHQVDGLTDADGELIVSPPGAVRVERRRAEPHEPDDPQHVRRRHLGPAHRAAAPTSGRPRRASSASGTSQASPTTASTRSISRSGCATRRPRSRCTPTPRRLEETDGKVRGMPYLALSEDQINELVAYLLERK